MSEQNKNFNFLDSLARKIVAKGLAMPATLFLEMHLPVATLAHSSTLLCSPLLSPLFGVERLSRYAEILSERDNLRTLIERIQYFDEPRETSSDSSESSEETR